MTKQRLTELINQAKDEHDGYLRLPRDLQDDDELMSREQSGDIPMEQPSGMFIVEAQEQFERAGFELDEVPWGAVLVRANELNTEA